MKIPKVYPAARKRLLCLTKSYVGQRPDGSKFNGYKAVIRQTPEEMMGITPNGTKVYKEKFSDNSMDLYMRTRDNVEIIAHKRPAKVSVVKCRDKQIISNTDAIAHSLDYSAGGDEKVLLKAVNRDDKIGEKTKGLPKFVKKLFELM